MWNTAIFLFALFSLLDLFCRNFPPIQISFKALCPRRSTSARLLIQLRLIGFVPYKVASWNIGSATGIPKTKASLKEIRHVNISAYCEVNKMGGSMFLLLPKQPCLSGGYFGFKPRVVTTVMCVWPMDLIHCGGSWIVPLELYTDHAQCWPKIQKTEERQSSTDYTYSKGVLCYRVFLLGLWVRV
jgi:hypothetical protein